MDEKNRTSDGDRLRAVEERLVALEMQAAGAKIERDGLRQRQQSHERRLGSTDRQKPGLEMRVGRLEDIEADRRSMVRWLTTGTIGTLLAAGAIWMISRLNGGGGHSP